MKHTKMFFLLLLTTTSLFTCIGSSAPQKKNPTYTEYGADLNNLHPSLRLDGPVRLEPYTIRQLTYSIELPEFLGAQSLLQETAAAFRVWEQALQKKLTFSRVNGTAHIQIHFVDAYHEDKPCSKGFEHITSTLAHAFSHNAPCSGGMIHLNQTLTWVLNAAQAEEHSHRYDLRTVLIHEIGHVLGLPHNSSEDSAMYKTYQGPKRDLSSLDEQNIRALYP